MAQATKTTATLPLVESVNVRFMVRSGMLRYLIILRGPFDKPFAWVMELKQRG